MSEYVSHDTTTSRSKLRAPTNMLPSSKNSGYRSSKAIENIKKVDKPATQPPFSNSIPIWGFIKSYMDSPECKTEILKRTNPPKSDTSESSDSVKIATKQPQELKPIHLNKVTTDILTELISLTHSQ